MWGVRQSKKMDSKTIWKKSKIDIDKSLKQSERSIANKEKTGEQQFIKVLKKIK